MSSPIRTDLALEARELWQQSAGQTTKLEGVRAREGERFGLPVTVVEVLDERGEKALGKGRGTYVTVELFGLARREKAVFARSVRAVAEQLRGLLGELKGDDCVLVAGLGNRAITPDCIGPEVCRHTLATRHLLEQLPEQFASFRPVAVLAPGVLGTTGMESGETVKAVCAALRPARVVVVDALACRGVERLCSTVQLTDAGIAPGSGVGNRRAALDRESLGIPVAAIGVPTVIDGATLAADLTGQAVPEGAPGRELLVTPRDIDSRAADIAKVIGYAIDLALHPGVELEELELLLS